ncbi:Ig-like domain-containing protein [Bacillus sp. 123MFChir2]|uniref:Ig-like domain-containing protein n=1 Tax=Bacillus sp. 123MFChir2 TaxID=1169144 RepID=UPI00048D82DA
MCYRQIVEHKIQLVPPALENTVTFTKTVEATIENVVPEKIVVCGVIHKTLTYTAILEDGTLVPGFQIHDDIPFQCVIDREDANEGDIFEVTGVAILGEVFAQEQNFGIINGRRVAFKFKEKEIVKICIRKLAITSIEVNLGFSLPSENNNAPAPDRLLVNGTGFAGIPVFFTVSGSANVSPTMVFTDADGFFNTTVTAFGPGDITLTAFGTVNGVPFSKNVTAPSPYA